MRLASAPQFEDLIADPMASVRNIYEYFDMELSSEAEQAMQKWLAEARAYKLSLIHI